MELLIPLRDREKSIFGNTAIEMKAGEDAERVAVIRSGGRK